ncbi:MAG: hypothetical protein SFY92_00610 [Verrucomicrobiae bacterium]|nr:hypothetical protein [Verrucomicrobiae bacterium]
MSDEERRAKLANVLKSHGATIPFQAEPPAPALEEPEEEKAVEPDYPEELDKPDEEPEEEIDEIRDVIRALAFNIKVLNNTMTALNQDSGQFRESVESIRGTVKELNESLAQRPTAPGANDKTTGKQNSSPGAWATAFMVCGSLALAVTLTVIALAQGKLNARFQDRITSLETLNVENRATLQKLATMGVRLEVRRPENGDGYYLVFKNTQRIQNGVPSQEGLNVRFWPKY